MNLPPDLITSLQNPRIKSALRLHQSRGRKQQNRTIIFGQREIQRAVAAKVNVETLFVAHDSAPSDGQQKGLFDQLKSRGVQPTFVTDEILEKLSYGNRVDGMVAIAERPETSIENLAVAESAVIIVLESVEKPGNVGAIVRSVDATGTDGIILANPLTDPFHPNSIRASTGAIFEIPIATCDSDRAIHWLEENGFQIYSAIVDSAVNLFETNLTHPKIAFVLGNEAEGLSAAWRSANTNAVKLPMHGIADSLNVSVTSAVMLFEAMRQRAH